MSTTVASPPTKFSFWRQPVDWLLVLSLLGSLPLLAVVCCDIWYRSDYRFFPLLIITPLVLVLWRSRYNVEPERITKSSIRKLTASGLWLASGICAIVAPLLFSPWLTVLALTLAWIAWLLDRLGTISWPRLLKWTLPLFVLLLLPLADKSDPLHSFASRVTHSSSSILDLLGIAHLPTEQTLQLRTGRYDVAAACRGLGNPYLLFTLTLLLCMSTQTSLSMGLITVATSPIWAWGGSVVLVVCSIWLAETQDIFLWLAPRLSIAQGVVLCGGLLSILFFKWGLRKLLAPFEAYSEGVASAHKLFNRAVLWPQPDPLRSRRSRQSAEANADESIDSPGRWLIANRAYVWASVGVLFLLGGGLAGYRLANNPSTWPPATELLHPTQFSQKFVEQRLTQTILPAEFFGATLIKFEEFATPGSTTGELLSARWTYSNSTHTIEILATAPYRGPAAMERQRLLDGGSVGDPLQTFEVRLVDGASTDGASTDGASTDGAKVDLPNIDAANTGDSPPDTGVAPSTNRKLIVSEMTLKDPVIGLTFLAYTHWPIDGSKQATDNFSKPGFWSRWLTSIAYQPTSASLSLWVEGRIPETDEEKIQWRQMLGHATEFVQHALAAP